MQTEEQKYLAERKEARTEPDSNEQPEQVEAVDVLEDSNPIAEAEESEATTDEEATEEIEESEAQKVEAQDEETDLFYYDIDGEEVSSDQIKEWKANGLMQADYTRKTQVNADKGRELDKRDESLLKAESKLAEQLLIVEAMVGEDNLDQTQLDELWDDDPDKWKELTEKQAKRKKLLKEAKVNAQPVSKVNTQDEQALLIKANPHWLDDNKPTAAYKEDMNALSKYYADKGFTQQQMNSVNESAVLAQAVIDAARFNSTNAKKAVVEKRVRKAPISTRPKAKAQTSLQSQIKSVSDRFNKTGDDKDFLLLRKLQRQQQN
jgi:hypothetical protein